MKLYFRNSAKLECAQLAVIFKDWYKIVILYLGAKGTHDHGRWNVSTWTHSSECNGVSTVVECGEYKHFSYIIIAKYYKREEVVLTATTIVMIDEL